MLQRYQWSALALILLALGLGYWTYVYRHTAGSTPEEAATSDTTQDMNQDVSEVAGISWKTFVTSATHRINASFDYPADSTVEEMTLGNYTAFVMVKEEKWDSLVLIIGDDERVYFERSILAAGATKSQASGDRGTFFTGAIVNPEMLVNGSLQLQQELGSRTLNLFIPTMQPSPGYTSILIDANADWSQEAFDYFTRSFAFMMRE